TATQAVFPPPSAVRDKCCVSPIFKIPRKCTGEVWARAETEAAKAAVRTKIVLISGFGNLPLYTVTVPPVDTAHCRPKITPCSAFPLSAFPLSSFRIPLFLIGMWEIQISIAAEQADPLAEVLAEGDAPAWHVFSDVDAGQSRLTGYFESKPAAQAAWDELRKTLPEAIAQAEPSYRELGDSDWKDSYEAHFHAWQFDRIHWVPIWEREQYTIPDGHEAVWLDPGLAFGTGNHETTRLCVERLVHCRRDWEREGRDFEQMRILDAGCGSGILAISAAKCGFTRVAGFDNDPIA